MLKTIANQTQTDWIRDVAGLDFWEIVIDDQTFSKNDGNLTYYVLR